MSVDMSPGGNCQGALQTLPVLPVILGSCPYIPKGIG